MLSLAMLTALGRRPKLKLDVHGALDPGLDRTEIARLSELAGGTERHTRTAADGPAGAPA
jgi:hypothetical protein